MAVLQVQWPPACRVPPMPTLPRLLRQTRPFNTRNKAAAPPGHGAGRCERVGQTTRKPLPPQVLAAPSMPADLYLDEVIACCLDLLKQQLQCNVLAFHDAKWRKVYRPSLDGEPRRRRWLGGSTPPLTGGGWSGGPVAGSGARARVAAAGRLLHPAGYWLTGCASPPGGGGTSIVPPHSLTCGRAPSPPGSRREHEARCRLWSQEPGQACLQVSASPPAAARSRVLPHAAPTPPPPPCLHVLSCSLDHQNVHAHATPPLPPLPTHHRPFACTPCPTFALGHGAS